MKLPIVTDPQSTFQRETRNALRDLEKDLTDLADAGVTGPPGADGADGVDGADGATGPAGPAPAGTGFVKVTAGVLEVPSASIAQAVVTNLVSDLAGKAALVHTHAESDVTSLVSDLAAKQPLDATLTALAGLDATAGLVEQTAADTFTKRALGVGASTSVPTRADADTRYAAASHTHAESDVTSLVSDLAAKQPLDATLTALAGLDSTAGLVEETAADTFTKRAIGVGASTSIPTRGDADTRYAAASHTHAESDVTSLVSDLAGKQPLDATLTALAGLNSTAGLVEETALDTFTKRAIGVSASTDIPTRADADGRYGLLSMAANSIRGNNTGSTASGIDLTATQATAMLNTFTTSLKGLAPSSGGGTTNYLRADGSWAAPSGTTAGLLLNVRVLTSTASPTYTPTSGTNKVLLQMVGAGGGGGGATGAVGSLSAGAGGGSGAFIQKWIDPGTTVTGGTYDCGTAGTAGSSGGGTGGTGGDTVITIQGTTYTAKGGTGGTGMGSGTALTATSAGYPQSGSTAADFEAGSPGTASVRLSVSYAPAGQGGSNPFGCGGPITGIGAGSDGRGYGAGGGGATVQTTSAAGGAGTQGLIVIYEYA